MTPGVTERKRAQGASEGPRVRVALTIAGFDPSSGAGLTADLQVFAAHGLFGVSAITALTVQSTVGVAEVQAVADGLLERTLRHLEADLPADGIKIGMLGSGEAIGEVVAFLRVKRGSGKIPVVLDPVLRASSGLDLLAPKAVERLGSELLPLVDWITPNWTELGALSGSRVESVAQARAAAERLGQMHGGLAIVVTGGEAADVTDLLWTRDGGFVEFRGQRVETSSTHGTGCAFSSALLSRLVLGDPPEEAVAGAKAYVAEALRSAPGIGRGHGPMGLLWPLRR